MSFGFGNLQAQILLEQQRLAQKIAQQERTEKEWHQHKERLFKEQAEQEALDALQYSNLEPTPLEEVVLDVDLAGQMALGLAQQFSKHIMQPFLNKDFETFGKTTHPDLLAMPAQVSCGWFHSFLMTDDGMDLSVKQCALVHSLDLVKDISVFGVLSDLPQYKDIETHLSNQLCQTKKEFLVSGEKYTDVLLNYMLEEDEDEDEHEGKDWDDEDDWDDVDQEMSIDMDMRGLSDFEKNRYLKMTKSSVDRYHLSQHLQNNKPQLSVTHIELLCGVMCHKVTQCAQGMLDRMNSQLTNAQRLDQLQLEQVRHTLKKNDIQQRQMEEEIRRQKIEQEMIMQTMRRLRF